MSALTGRSAGNAFFCDLRRKRRGSVPTMTPHQRWNVCHCKERKKVNQFSSSFTHAGHQAFDRMCTSSFHLQTMHTKHAALKKGEERKLTMFQLYQNWKKLTSQPNSKGLADGVPSPLTPLSTCTVPRPAPATFRLRLIVGAPRTQGFFCRAPPTNTLGNACQVFTVTTGTKEPQRSCNFRAAAKDRGQGQINLHTTCQSSNRN